MRRDWDLGSRGLNVDLNAGDMGADDGADYALGSVAWEGCCTWKGIASKLFCIGLRYKSNTLL